MQSIEVELQLLGEVLSEFFFFQHVSTSGHSSSPLTPRPAQTPAPPSLKHSADPMNTYFAPTTNYHTIDDLQFDDTDDLQYDDIPEIPLPPSNSVPTLAPYSPVNSNMT